MLNRQKFQLSSYDKEDALFKIYDIKRVHISPSCRAYSRTTSDRDRNRTSKGTSTEKQAQEEGNIDFNIRLFQLECTKPWKLSIFIALTHNIAISHGLK
jgi:hypothetical protein